MNSGKLSALAVASVAVLTVGYFIVRGSARSTSAPKADAPLAAPTSGRVASPSPPSEPESRVPTVDAIHPTPPAAPAVQDASRSVAESSGSMELSTDAPTRPAAKAKKPKRELKDPLSRKALELVGMNNTDAQAYWMNAINNAALPAEERSDLIEDLNEEGFADPDNPTVEELPLIVNRIGLIVSLAPSSMDKVNADAFNEALKDLTLMYARLTQ